MRFFDEILKDIGISGGLIKPVSLITFILFTVAACFIVTFIIDKILMRIVTKIAKRTNSTWHPILIKRKFYSRVSHIAPIIIVFLSIEIFNATYAFVSKIAVTYLILMIALTITSILDSIDDVYRTYPISNERPIKGFLQIVKIVIFIISGIVFISVIIEKNPAILLSGLGALSAVLMLVFKDSILGFVAGIQLASNDMLRIGDWIEMTKYGADGDIIDISLNTVKVQNFDKTIVTIPAYYMISDSFKNWRGMKEANGRRIKRSVFIDMTSVRFCDEKMLDEFRKIALLTNYIDERRTEINLYNQQNDFDQNVLINGRKMTNIGTFREYVTRYLKEHSGVHPDMIQMVRQLPPNEVGLPLEIYVFSNTTNWIEFENIQSDIFDHILASIPTFGLRVYQSPTGYDINRISKSE